VASAPATSRASFYVYNDEADLDALVRQDKDGPAWEAAFITLA